MLNIISGLIVFSTFFEIVLKFVENGENYYRARSVIEILLFLICAAGLVRRGLSPFFTGGFVFVVLAFPMLVAVTSLINEDFSSNYDFLFVTVRFIPLAAVLATYDQDVIRTRLNKILDIILAIQVVASIPQLLRLGSIVEMMLPLQIEGFDTRIAADFDNWDYSIFGTFPESISLAFFLLAYIIYAVSVRKVRLTSFRVIVPLLLIYFTQSFIAGALAAGYLATQVFTWRILLAGAVVSALVPAAVGSLIYINGFTLNEYIGLADTGRLGIILYTFPAFVLDSSVTEFLFGIGRNAEAVRAMVFSVRFVPEVFYAAAGVAPLEDVFYVAVLMYFGVFGVISYFGIFLANYLRLSKLGTPEAKCVLALTVCIAVGCMVNQMTSVKIFSAMYWAMSGLAMARQRTAAR